MVDAFDGDKEAGRARADPHATHALLSVDRCREMVSPTDIISDFTNLIGDLRRQHSRLGDTPRPLPLC